MDGGLPMKITSTMAAPSGAVFIRAERPQLAASCRSGDLTAFHNLEVSCRPEADVGQTEINVTFYLSVQVNPRLLPIDKYISFCIILRQC